MKRKSDSATAMPRITPAMSFENEQLMVMVMKKMNKLYQQQAEQRNVQNN